MRNLAAVLATGVCVVAMASPAHAQTQEYRIPAGSLKAALDSFARQSGRQVIYRTDEVRGADSPGVAGTMSADAALERVLTGTGFVARRDSSGALAIVRAGSGAASLGAGEAAAGTAQDYGEGEEIVVTGTNIRGVANNTAPLEVFTRTDIEKTGRTTTQDFVRTLTQNFRGGASGGSEDGVLNGQSGLANVESASGVNLRGLGTNSTLVLLNGHRIAAAAYGSVVDVSMIPLDALERVEVLTNGASSIYGADAVGGVVNFVLRKDYEGAETNVQVGTTTRGGREQIIAGQTVGSNWSTGGVVASVQYQRDENLNANDRSFSRTAPGPTDLFPQRDQYSAILSLHQDLSPSIGVFGDVLYSHQDQTRRYDNGIEDHRQLANIDFVSASAGVDWRIGGDWHLSATGLYSAVDTDIRSFYEPARGFYTNGEKELANRVSLFEATGKLDGTLVSLGASDLKFAGGVSFRQDRIHSRAPASFLDDRATREVRSVFGELLLPIHRSPDEGGLFRRLELSASVRLDDYSDFGTTTNPSVGLLWSPVEGLDFRASYGTSFRAPNLGEIVGNDRNRFIFAFPGFTLPDGSSGTVLLLTASPALKPEKSKNLSLGISYSPPKVRGLRGWLNYYRVDYRDRIIVPPFDVSAVANPDVYGPLIGSFENDAAVAQFINGLVQEGYQFFDYAGNGTAGIRNSFYIGSVNAARVQQDGFDFGAEYATRAGPVDVDLRGSATLIRKIETAFCDNCATTNILNVYGQPTRWRVRSQANFRYKEFGWRAALNHVNGYRDTNTNPAGHISAWTTLDLSARYEPTWMKNTTFALNVINLFDSNPPRTAGAGAVSNIFYDSANADPLGRVVNLQARVRW